MKFWKDCWIGDVLLAHAFSSFFEMAFDVDTWVSSQIQDNDWAFTFHNPLSLLRFQVLPALLCTLQLHTFLNALDQAIWMVGPSATFIVCSQYHLLQPSQLLDKAAKNLWKASAQLKIKITMSLVILDRLPTGHYLPYQVAIVVCFLWKSP